eukprot:gnl/TRDRNA2_/TRDRNA2_51099_c0_seq1.p1 gnl/TRDRNA2_/TRDRNA2_51099_c0~~gnl/TRDRNA2_/TRDRNA2_51099_c0_seq1.p1  ORF type:complete len:429 (+),score=67.87 gnl/TRDRNA2_/TRDRNA2_51099_c0_seq1:81-1367(+)
MPDAPAPRLAVLGAGPIGLELALGAVSRGMQVEVFERGPSCASAVEAYKFVELFSPWSMNSTETGLAALSEAGLPLPESDKCPTGREFVDSYLMPLSRTLQSSPLCGLHLNTEVISIGRGALLKSESIGGGGVQMPKDKPLVKCERKETPFRILVREEGVGERYADNFDLVADCTGSYSSERANWAGVGGMPAVGERSLRCKGRLWTTIPDVLGCDRGRFAGRRTLIIGSGYSAGTTVRNLAELAAAEQNTTVFWLTRGCNTPYTIIEDDVLPQRKRLCEVGNQAADGKLANVQYIGGAAVHSMEAVDNGSIRVAYERHTAGAQLDTQEVDEVVTCTGFRPDMSLYEELQVHQCYASNGPIKLAATLIGGSGDCLKQVSAGVDTLKSPEPGFFILGSKSYGRNSAFLLKIGHEQIRAVLDDVAPPAKL